MTDAEFLLWLRNGARQAVILAELGYVYDVAGVRTTGTMYFSDAPYATGSAESPASTAYRDVIVSAPGYARALDQDTLGGRARFSVGTLELDNSDGSLDYLFDRIIDGYTATFLLGGATWARSEFRTIFAAAMTSIKATETSVTIGLRDNAALLDKRVSGAVIGGSGPNAERRRPLVFGRPQRVEAVLADETSLRYYIGSDLTNAAFDVYDSGLLHANPGVVTVTSASVNADNDRISYDTALQPGAPAIIDGSIVRYTKGTSGTVPSSSPALVEYDYYWVRNVETAGSTRTFQLSTTSNGSVIDFLSASFTATLEFWGVGYVPYSTGAIDLDTTAVGVVTVNYSIPPSTGYPAGVTGDAFSDVVEHFLTIEAGNPVSYLGAHDSAAALTVDPSVGLYITEPTNVMDVLDELVTTINGFWSITRSGAFQYGRIMPGGELSFATAAYTITDDDVMRRSVTLDRMPPRYSRFACIYDKNWTPQQSGFALAVSADDIAYAQGPGRVATGAAESGTSYSTAPSLYHKTITESPEVETLIVGAASASQWLADAKAMWKPHNEVIGLTTHLGFYQLELGDVVDLDLGVFGLTSVNAQVIGIDVSLSDARIKLTLIRKRVPVHPAFQIDVSWAELEVPT